ncbi:MAG: hypothetical protein GWP61_10580 [Chloroflexi bacterium]|jgi:hypothetical protein|nr:hypothetical protein [Chloroflexota bacterium]
MVDALLECWRILGREGALIDLRPVHSNPAIEVISAGTHFVPGHLVDEMGAADDVAADEAMVQVVRRGYFAPQMQETFKFASYWDTLEGLLAYADKKWRGHKRLPPAVLRQAQRHIADIFTPYRICIRNTIHLAVYKKQEPPLTQ